NIHYVSNYGEIEGEDWRYDGCDFERKNGIAEPRPLARGNIARAIFYMHREYGIPIEKDILVTLKEWNRKDPPSAHELKRNNKIEKIQG
ncbi:MAG: nuclease, partial [Candidatus Dadabacteria bacterium]|nr:nuclease [Candidatus Dadabacteria bacterium]